MSKGSRQRPTKPQFGNNFDQIDWSKGKDDKPSTEADSGKPTEDKNKARRGEK